MKIKITSYLAYLIAVATCLSCENMIETDMPINQLNTEQVFETVSTADGALSALYADMQSASIISGGMLGSGALLGSYIDDLDCYDAYSVNASMDIHKNLQLPTNTTVQMIWTNAYKEIFMANSIINGIEKSTTIPEKDANRIKGEAIFMRSLVYYYLTELFGDIPYTTSIDYHSNSSLSKTANEKVLAFIKEDLLMATQLLQDTYKEAERLYINKKTVELLLSQVYVRQKNWNEAETILKNIIASPLYTLQSDISKTFKKDGKHILWQLKPIFTNNATPEALLYFFYSTTPSSYAASDNLVQSFSSDDKRKSIWLDPIVGSQKTYYKINKYKTITGNTDERSIVFRLEEVYLLLAECLVNQDKKDEALSYINPIRQKAGLPILSGSFSKEEINTFINNEYRKEFFAERGIRFMYLKRTGKLNDMILVKPNWKSYHNLWPLPVSELLLNPKINPQNTGY